MQVIQTQIPLLHTNLFNSNIALYNFIKRQFVHDIFFKC